MDDVITANDDKESCEDRTSEIITTVVNKHLSHVAALKQVRHDESCPHRAAIKHSNESLQMSPLVSSQAKSQGSDWSLHKPSPDSMANSLIARSEADSLSQDTGVFSMPSSMISSHSMALSFAAEMDSSGFFSDLESGQTGRSSAGGAESEEISVNYYISLRSQYLIKCLEPSWRVCVCWPGLLQTPDLSHHREL